MHNLRVKGVIALFFLSSGELSLLFNFCRSIGQFSLLAVSEVTVGSVAPIPAAFAFAVVGVKRAVNPSEEAGGPQHYVPV